MEKSKLSLFPLCPFACPLSARTSVLMSADPLPAPAWRVLLSCLHVQLPACLSVHLSPCLRFCLPSYTVHLPACLYVQLYISMTAAPACLYICWCSCTSVCLPTLPVHQYVFFYFWLAVCTSACVYIFMISSAPVRVTSCFLLLLSACMASSCLAHADFICCLNVYRPA